MDKCKYYVKMDTYEVYVNENIYLISDEKELIELLKKDDEFLIQYICNKIKQGTGPPVHPADIEGFLNIRRLPKENAEINFEVDYQSDGFTGSEEHEMFQDKSQDLTGCEEHEMSEEISQFDEDSDENQILVDVWSHKGKTLEADHKATELLLELRGAEKFVNRFNDKKTSKLKLWKEISDHLYKKRYLADAEKCRQKFTNLTKKYVEFVRHCKKTGNETKKQPLYYDLLHKILGDKDKVQLRDVTDTILTVVVDSGEIDASISETPTACVTPRTSAAPKQRQKVLTKTDIINKITECNEKNIAIQQETTNKICAAIHEQTNLMNKQIEQKDRLLKIFEKMSKTRKRKRQTSSESD